MPYRRGARGMPPLMRSLDVIGSNVDQFECPRCGAHDRERHLLASLSPDQRRSLADLLRSLLIPFDADPGG